MKVYVITKGEYSDYHICAVATDKEKAEEIRKKYSQPWEAAEIEEYDTEETEMLMYKNLYVCIYYKKSKSIIVNETSFEYPPSIEFMVKDSTSQLSTHVNADDKVHAFKIASDRFAKYLAEKQGL